MTWRTSWPERIKTLISLKVMQDESNIVIIKKGEIIGVEIENNTQPQYKNVPLGCI